APTSEPPQVAMVSADSRDVEAAQSPRERPLRIIPTPKKFDLNGSGFRIGPGTRLEIRQSGNDSRLSQFLASLFDQYNFTPESHLAPAENGHVEIRIG